MPVDELDRVKAALSHRYAIERAIGRGGMATVYLAEDLKHHRKVAIKVLRPELAAALGGERFLREIEIVSNLTHPHILPLHDSGEAGGFLYYVMPYVEGESLQHRLRRVKQLPLTEALRITREVADALQHAHRSGIVHRDIKPANILLEAGHAVVSDFGIARALTEAGGEKLTVTGHVVGTPVYMSFEQAAGDADVDCRSDQYSLACVLYEMLAGQTPYTGGTPGAILAEQLKKPAPSLRTACGTAPPSVDHALCRALATDPEDRFPTVDDFVAALDDPSYRRMSFGHVFRAVRPRTAASILGGVTVLTGVTWMILGGALDLFPSDTPADTSRYAIFPFEYESGLETSLNEMQLLHDALSRWSGLTVADPFQVREALDQKNPELLTPSNASSVALGLGAGRYLLGSVSRLGDSLRVRAGLYDATANGTLLADHTVRVAHDLTGVDSLFAALTDRLLFRGSLPDDAPALFGTRSLPARQAFARGQHALEAWDLAKADSAFTSATQLDPRYAQAHLWTALARAWTGAKPAVWQIPAEQASLGREHLSTRDAEMTDAILAQARGDLAKACAQWQRLTVRYRRDFAGWYGWAYCQANDHAVVADRTSPSGWSFRTSYHSALEAHQQAFRLLPSILVGFRRGSYEPLRRLLMTGGNESRIGGAVAPDTTTFVADPAWQRDSLAFVPYQRQPSNMRQRFARSAELDEAVRRQRLLFRDIAMAWVAAVPSSPDALEALALSLAMLGDQSSLDTLRRARELLREPEGQLRLVGAEVWLRVAFSLPSRPDQLRRARELADSILGEFASREGADPQLLAALAALTGRAHLAAAYMREPGVAAKLELPGGRGPAAELLVYSALGGPVDSLIVLERRVSSAIEGAVPDPQRHGAALQWLGRPATLAFPTHRLEALSDLAGQGDYLLDLQAAWIAGDTATVRRGLSELREARRPLLPSNLTFDALYPEAELLVALGDLQGACAWLDPTLQALPQIAPTVLADPVRVASLVRAMALRARLAERLHDPEISTLWAEAVVTLWSDADPFLQPLVRELARLAS